MRFTVTVKERQRSNVFSQRSPPVTIAKKKKKKKKERDRDVKLVVVNLKIQTLFYYSLVPVTFRFIVNICH